MLSKYIAPALAVAGVASAATSTASICGSTATATISSQADVTQLSSCGTLSGSVAIASTAANSIDLGDITNIEGNFVVEEAVNLTSLSGSSLTNIGGKFFLNGLTILSTLSFPALTSVGSIEFEALPALQALTFTEGISSAGDLLITNTQLSSLDGINLAQASSFDVNNNLYLKTVSTQIANISGLLNIEANGKNLTVEFPNLEWAANMTFRNCSSISLPSLAHVNGSLGFYENYMLTVNAPNLTSTGGDLAFVANPDLTNITMPKLTSVGGGYQIANNSALLIIDGFEALKTVAGALDFTGNFTDVELPNLSEVDGGFNMQSSGNFSCSAFKTDKSNGVIRGTYTCTPTSDNVQTGTSSSGSGTSTGASSTKTGAASISKANGVAMGAAAVFGGLALAL